jgi:hypothetical protein
MIGRQNLRFLFAALLSLTSAQDYEPNYEDYADNYENQDNLYANYAMKQQEKELRCVYDPRGFGDAGDSIAKNVKYPWIEVGKYAQGERLLISFTQELFN